MKLRVCVTCETCNDSHEFVIHGGWDIRDVQHRCHSPAPWIVTTTERKPPGAVTRILPEP